MFRNRDYLIVRLHGEQAAQAGSHRKIRYTCSVSLRLLQLLTVMVVVVVVVVVV